MHARRCPSVLLKIDLAKAFDSVAWPFLLEVLEHAGFPTRWRGWVSAMLYTVSTKVLVNGRLGDRILHACGLRQGDPLSPLLFIIVMEVLNVLIAEAYRQGVFSPLPDKIKYRTSIYGDDCYPPVPRCLGLRQHPPHSGPVRRYLGLVTNVDKCIITPIRCS
jgi:hypothetical protein